MGQLKAQTVLILLIYMYLGTKKKKLRNTLLWLKRNFTPLCLGQKPGFSYFILHVKRTFDLYCWEELNFGQEPVFLEVSVLKLIPGSCFLTTKLLSPPSSVWEVER